MISGESARGNGGVFAGVGEVVGQITGGFSVGFELKGFIAGDDGFVALGDSGVSGGLRGGVGRLGGLTFGDGDVLVGSYLVSIGLNVLLTDVDVADEIVETGRIKEPVEFCQIRALMWWRCDWCDRSGYRCRGW